MAAGMRDAARKPTARADARISNRLWASKCSVMASVSFGLPLPAAQGRSKGGVVMLTWTASARSLMSMSKRTLAVRKVTIAHHALTVMRFSEPG